MKIIVCPFNAVDLVLAASRPTHVVSLLAPATPTPACLDHRADLRTLSLALDDIADDQPGLVAPRRDHVAELLAFVADRQAGASLLIHCWAGVSRSTAAAYIAACLRDGPGQEMVLAERLRHAAPFATPNRRLIALADEMMGRDGAMIAAIEAIGQGVECTLGEPFEL